MFGKTHIKVTSGFPLSERKSRIAKARDRVTVSDFYRFNVISFFDFLESLKEMSPLISPAFLSEIACLANRLVAE